MAPIAAKEPPEGVMPGQKAADLTKGGAPMGTEPPPARPLKAGEKKIRVRATKSGYHDLIRRREGDVFTVHESVFSSKWMERVPAATPERVTTGNEELRRQHDETVAARQNRSTANMGDEGPDPLHAGDDD